MSLEAWGDENPLDAEDWSDIATDQGWFDPADYSPGAIAILKERDRQETDEGWSPDHDDQYSNFELIQAALTYASHAAIWDERTRKLTRPTGWPWKDEWWKPEDRRRDLVKAGALIAAEIDRLDRLEKSQTKTE